MTHEEIDAARFDLAQTAIRAMPTKAAMRAMAEALQKAYELGTERARIAWVGLRALQALSEANYDHPDIKRFDPLPSGWAPTVQQITTRCLEGWDEEPDSDNEDWPDGV